MSEPQHGRKPQKKWHRHMNKKKLKKLKRWPKVADVPYDGAPQAMPQGNKGWKMNRRIDEA